MHDPRMGFHEWREAARGESAPAHPRFRYTFENFFHPFVGELIQRLNRRSVPGLLDPVFQAGLAQEFFDSNYGTAPGDDVQVKSFPKEIDVSVGGPYANYNWELFFHIPVAIAVHLSNNQRFAEAQRWMHYVFDPTTNDTSVDPPERYWKFLRFRQKSGATDIAHMLALLSKGGQLSDEERAQVDELLAGYAAINRDPFQPHRVAATRPVAYQYYVLMKYLDNLIAWGDSLFREDTVESINEATQRYVLASAILGPRPQPMPERGTVAPKTFAQLQKEGLDKLGNALVDLESQFPFNLAPSSPQFASDNPQAAPISGIGRTLYFCVPRNDRLLAYWDTVADRLYKIRNCMNIEGTTRQLALFEPRIDPGLLVKAAAVGIDAGAAAAGQLRPVGPLRTPALLDQALELAGEVRALGQQLLGAIEKADSEHLMRLRQGNEVNVQRLAQDVRYLQWRHAQAATDVLLRARRVAIERHRHYQRLLGKTVAHRDELEIRRPAPDEPPLLNEANFDEKYGAMVAAYDPQVSVTDHPPLRLVQRETPTNEAGAAGAGKLSLTATEDKELNEHLPSARDHHYKSADLEADARGLALIPDVGLNLHFWGLGLHASIFGGTVLSTLARIAAGRAQTEASLQQDQAGMASRAGSYERRADDWVHQGNLAARELREVGKQVLAAVIAEQAAHREYLNAKKQGEQEQAAADFLQRKFTNEELYGWIQGEVTRLFYDYYRFAIDVARKAEQTMKRELMRPEVDANQYVKTDYLHAGRQGLLAGEALVLDLRRMQLAYRENRRREYELTRHVSLLQLDPMALLQLKTTGSCEFSIPEAFFDLDCPGHYMRRIQQVRLSVPAVAGPYTSVACTLSLLRSSVRVDPTAAGYAREGDDPRFVDYAGVIQSIVTSGARDDGGVFDSSARDERFLPFEGAGAISAWRLELPDDFRQFDYDTIADVILHVQYTAREGGGTLRQAAVGNLTALAERAQATGSTRLFAVRQEFPSEWSASRGNGKLLLELDERHYPYWSRGMDRQAMALALVASAPGTASSEVTVAGQPTELAANKALRGLLYGKVDAEHLPAATGPVAISLPDHIEDLWLLVTWSGSRPTEA